MKTFSAPQFSYRSNPVCFYNTPVQQFPFTQSVFVPPQHPQQFGNQMNGRKFCLC